MKAIVLILAIVLSCCIAGCDGSGGMGGQGLSFKDIAVHEGGHFQVDIDITDGGTALMGGNPTAATTQPSQ